jgi:hypothetical protein
MAIGDSHGNSRFVHAAIERAARLRDKVDRAVFIVSVDDFGFWPGGRGEAFVGGVDELARRHGLAFWAIDGNHDYPGDCRSSRAGYRAWSDRAPSPDQPGLVHVPAAPSFAFRPARLLESPSASVEAPRHPTKSNANPGRAGGPKR